MSELVSQSSQDPQSREGSLPMRFSNREAEQEWSGPVITQAGMDLLIRPASPSDHDALQSFFEQVSREDLYFRFLSGIRHVDEDRLQHMLCDDDDRSIDFLALDPDSGEILSSAMLASDEAFETAEFAVVTRQDMKGRGISWALLDHAVRYAKAMGIKKVSSLESASQAGALRLEREMGFTTRSCPDDATLMLVEKTL